MTYTFEMGAERRRFHAFKNYQVLTSPTVVMSLVASVVAATLGWLLVALLGASALLVGLTLIMTSVAAGLVLVFIFATTYYPWLLPTSTVSDLTTKSGNIATASDFFLLGILGTYGGDAPATFAALLTTQSGTMMLSRLQLPAPELIQAARDYVWPTVAWARILEQTVLIAQRLEARVIGPEHVLLAVLLQPALQKKLRHYDLVEKDLVFVAWWVSLERTNQAAAGRWWEPERLLGFTGIGLAWTSGFTPLVDQFSRFPVGNLWDRIIVGRESQVEQLITTLARQRQSNVLLVGQPGVGRLGVVQAMARRVRAGTAHPELRGQRVVYIHVGEVLARGTTSASQLAVVSQVLSEMERAGNVIAIIDGLGSILAEEGEGRLNMTDVLLPFFSSLAVRVVVIISSDEYHLRLKTNEELIHFFEVVQIESVAPQVALQVLALAAPQLERETGIQLPYKTLRAIIEGTESILSHIPYPERAFDFLEEALVVAAGKQRQILEPPDIDALITQKVGVPVGRVREHEREQLLSLETLMHERVVNQHRAVATVAHAMIRSRAGVRTKERPIGTFLFLGPTGVGKTETAKTLAYAYFGSEEYVTRLDMSEFQLPDASRTLIGSSEQPVGRLTSLMSNRPFTVLLLDEFEKAHPTIQQLFLQVFDEGRLTDARGQTVSFRHAIIITTSNAGAELIRETVAAGVLPENFDVVLREHILKEGIFRPELLNRFDGVVTFTPLTPEHIKEVAVKMLRKLNKRLDDEHGVTVAVTGELLEYLVSIGYHPEFGARPMARAIQDTVEYAVAQQVLRGTTKPGQKITLSPAVLKAQRIVA